MKFTAMVITAAIGVVLGSADVGLLAAAVRARRVQVPDVSGLERFPSAVSRVRLVFERSYWRPTIESVVGAIDRGW